MKYNIFNHLIKLITSALCLLILSGTVYSQRVLQTNGRAIVDSSGNPVHLRGIGLGGWLVPEGYMLDIPGFGSPTAIRNMIIDLIGSDLTDEFYQQYEANYVTEADIELIAEWGFNSIRIPFHYQLLTSLATPTVFKEEGFQLLDTLLAWCKRNSLYLILDLHCAPGGQNPGPISDSPGTAELWGNPVYLDLTVAMWRKIAEHYVGEPWIAGYDLLNEPVLSGSYNNIHLRTLYFRLTQAIREVDPDHILFIEGNWYATDFNLLTPPFDNNLVYAFHNYWSAIDLSSIQNYINISRNNNVPIWLGEFGENSNHWAQETIRILEEQGIGWNWWTHKKLTTITSPLSARMPPGFQNILDYWRGEAQRPSTTQAYVGLLALTENLALENCEFHPDVLHALTTTSSASVPYMANILPGNLPVQNYDMGLEGQAYHDNDFAKTHWDRDEPWNRGYVGRSDGVDLEQIDDQPGEFNIGWIEDQEWINYSVIIQRGGLYRITLESSAPHGNGLVSFKIDDTPLLSGINIPNTDGYFDWVDFTAGDVSLPEGTHQLRLVFNRGGFNLKSMGFKLITDSSFVRLSEDIFLGETYPNPFNSATTLPIMLNRSQKVKVEIFNLQGNEITTLFDGLLPNGLSSLYWYGHNNNGQLASSGTYFYRIQIGRHTIKRKVSLIR